MSKLVSETRPKINNVKVHISINKDCINILKKALFKYEQETVTKNKKSKVKKFPNYISIKENFTYIIFPKGGYINITGIPSLEEIKNVKTELCKDFSLQLHMLTEEVIIDNISASGDFNYKINIPKLQHILKNTDFKTKFDRDFFPGIFCYTYTIGTIIIYNSGKYVIVGAKCLQDVKTIHKKMFVHIQILSMMT
jgi:TATA-box binding protein (TBP) (component of TFIID and TFIIIB)